MGDVEGIHKQVAVLTLATGCGKTMAALAAVAFIEQRLGRVNRGVARPTASQVSSRRGYLLVLITRLFFLMLAPFTRRNPNFRPRRQDGVIRRLLDTPHPPLIPGFRRSDFFVCHSAVN